MLKLFNHQSQTYENIYHIHLLVSILLTKHFPKLHLVPDQP